MARVHAIVKGLNKNMIVWKERSKTPEGVIPMIYKNVNETPGVTADGYNVIVAPASHTYFDFYQGMHSQEPLAYGGHTYLSQVYAFFFAGYKIVFNKHQCCFSHIFSCSFTAQRDTIINVVLRLFFTQIVLEPCTYDAW